MVKKCCCHPIFNLLLLFCLTPVCLLIGCNADAGDSVPSASSTTNASSVTAPIDPASATAAAVPAPNELGKMRAELSDLREQLRTVQERVAMLDGLAAGPKNVAGGRAIDPSGIATNPGSRAALSSSADGVSQADLPIVPAEYTPTSAFKDDPFLGPDKAPVVVMVFSDFQCPGCRRFDADVVGRLRVDYAAKGKVKLIFRDFPLDRNRHARSAAMLAHCAGEQGKYWSMYDLLYTQSELVDSGKLDGLARMLRAVDKPALKRCRDSLRYEKELDRDLAEGRALGAGGAPGTFIGKRVDGKYRGVFVRGAQPFQVIEQELAAILND